MAPMMRRASDRLHPLSLDTVRPSMAKADLQNLDIDCRQAIGRALVRARGFLGWSQKEAAARADVDPATYAKWENGDERHRPQFDRLFAVEEMRQPLVVCLAALADDVEVVTEIRFRRQA